MEDEILFSEEAIHNRRDGLSLGYPDISGVGEFYIINQILLKHSLDLVDRANSDFGLFLKQTMPAGTSFEVLSMLEENLEPDHAASLMIGDEAQIKKLFENVGYAVVQSFDSVTVAEILSGKYSDRLVKVRVIKGRKGKKMLEAFSVTSGLEDGEVKSEISEHGHFAFRLKKDSIDSLIKILNSIKDNGFEPVGAGVNPHEETQGETGITTIYFKGLDRNGKKIKLEIFISGKYGNLVKKHKEAQYPLTSLK